MEPGLFCPNMLLVPVGVVDVLAVLDEMPVLAAVLPEKGFVVLLEFVPNIFLAVFCCGCVFAGLVPWLVLVWLLEKGGFPPPPPNKPLVLVEFCAALEKIEFGLLLLLLFPLNILASILVYNLMRISFIILIILKYPGTI